MGFWGLRLRSPLLTKPMHVQQRRAWRTWAQPWLTDDQQIQKTSLKWGKPFAQEFSCPFFPALRFFSSGGLCFRFLSELDDGKNCQETGNHRFSHSTWGRSGEDVPFNPFLAQGRTWSTPVLRTSQWEPKYPRNSSEETKNLVYFGENKNASVFEDQGYWYFKPILDRNLAHI